MSSPQARYAAALADGTHAEDPAQARAAAQLEQVHLELLARAPRRRFGARQWPAVRGLYLWGGVGRGKTWLMDLFHDALPFRRKHRTHFHRFMLEVHARRGAFEQEQDPIAKVADGLADQFRVLCFDEFFVSDIADAMILARLLDRLFARGVTLVATSNAEPGVLYRDGLQRERFLPAIALLERHCTTLELDSDTDYRLRTLTAADLYHHPCNAAAEGNLAAWFDRLACDAHGVRGPLRLCGRPLAVRRAAEGVAWFDFTGLCESPRSAADYVELARTHHSVLLGRVPAMTADDDDAARRFITLVDTLYDRAVKLIVAADVPSEGLYAGRRLAFEFERTRSRLVEMRSREYLERPHLA